MKLDAAKEREHLVEARTALKYTELALQKAENNVTVNQLRDSVVPLLTDLQSNIAPQQAPVVQYCSL